MIRRDTPRLKPGAVAALTGLAILLIIGLAALQWVRGTLPLSWEQFGALAVAIPTLGGLAAAVARRLRSRAVPDLVIEYADGKGRRTRRGITIRHVDVAARGLLQDAVSVQAWCHLRHGLRTFLTDHIVSAAIPSVPRPAWPRQALLQVAARKPRTVRQRPELTLVDAWPPSAPGEPVVQPLNVLLRRTGDRADIAMLLSEVLRDASGLIFAVRGRNPVTQRVDTALLTELDQIAPADTGEAVAPGNVQRWLGSLCHPAVPPGPPAAWTPPRWDAAGWAWLAGAAIVLLALGAASLNGAGYRPAEADPPAQPPLAPARPAPVLREDASDAIDERFTQDVFRTQRIALLCGTMLPNGPLRAQIDGRFEAALQGMPPADQARVRRLAASGAAEAEAQVHANRDAACAILTPDIRQALRDLGAGHRRLFQP